MDLKIKQLEWSETRNIGNYENKKLGLIVEVLPNQNPDKVLKETKIYIQNKFDEKEINKTAFKLTGMQIKYELLEARYKKLSKLVDDEKEIEKLESKLKNLRDKVNKIDKLINDEEEVNISPDRKTIDAILDQDDLGHF